MKIFVIGSGAREHALVWKFAQSPKTEKIYCSPGNGGIAQAATLVPGCAENDWNSFADFAVNNGVGLTVIGPEVPLAEGITDVFRKRNLKIFGPDQKAAQLEGSKIFSKMFMRKYGIPTADFQVFEDATKAVEYCRLRFQEGAGSLVVKADGLAAGKGVAICESLEEARQAVENMLVRKAFGRAGEKILIEERLFGEEFSLMSLCDGKTIKTLPAAKDYKRVFDGNQGPNTGGMGAIAPCEIPKDSLPKIQKNVIEPFLNGVRSENLDYRGVIYFGLMLTDKGPYVLEFNVRFGDPETQVILPLIKNDFCDLFAAVADRQLERIELKTEGSFCLGVVCASGGYPGKFDSGREIRGLENLSLGTDVFVFHAGTANESGKLRTSGGRVLNVVAKAEALEETRRKAYETVAKISFEGMHYRKDIGSSNAASRLLKTAST